MKKRVLSVLLTLIISVGMIPTLSSEALAASDRVTQMVNAMSLRDKVTQMIMAWSFVIGARQQVRLRILR